MSTKKIELKVAINCLKCKTVVMKAVAKLKDVDSVTVDAEKGTLTVLGSVDPVCIVISIRKTGKCAEITSVGPPKKPDPPKKDKPETPKPCTLPACCKQCQLVAVSYETHYGVPCSIL